MSSDEAIVAADEEHSHLTLRSMPNKRKGNGPGKAAATEQQAPLLQNTTEAFGALAESYNATVTP